MSQPAPGPNKPSGAPSTGPQQSPAEIAEAKAKAERARLRSEVVPKSANMRLQEEFLQNEGITVENFNKDFNIGTAIKFLDENDASNKDLPLFKEMNGKLESWDELDMFNISDPTTFYSKLDRAFIAHKVDAEEAKTLKPRMRDAHAKYIRLHDNFYRRLNLKKEMDAQLQTQKHEVGTSFQEDIGKLAGNIGQNYGQMSGSEKFIVVGGLLFVTAMLFNSEDARVQKFTDTLLTCAKIAGTGYLINKVYKLATGETAFDAISNAAKDTVAKPQYWMDTFHTDGERAAMLRDAAMHIGDKEFPYLAQQYRQAKAHGRDEIDLAFMDNKMTPKQVFTAMDVFFKKYGRQKVNGKMINVEDKYEDLEPPPTFRQVLMEEMVQDKSVKLPEGVAARTYDQAKNYVSQGYDWLAVKTGAGYEAGKEAASDGWNWIKSLYRRTFGKEGTDAEYEEFRQKHIGHEMVKAADFDTYVRSKMGAADAQGFIEAKNQNKLDTKNNVTYYQDPTTKWIYAIAKNRSPFDGKEDAYKKSLEAANQQSLAYLKENYGKDIKGDFGRMVTFEQGFSMDDGSTVVLARMPGPGTTAFFSREQFGKGPNEGKDAFGDNDKVEYGIMKPWEQEIFRLRFLVDANQATIEINKICEILSTHYRGKYTRQEVRDRLFDVNKKPLIEREDMEMVLKEYGYTRPLATHQADLDQAERDKTILDIEQEVTHKKHKNAPQQNEMLIDVQTNFGYRVRLAILGDSEAVRKVRESGYAGDINADPKGPFLKWYQEALETQYLPKK